MYKVESCTRSEPEIEPNCPKPSFGQAGNRKPEVTLLRSDFPSELRRVNCLTCGYRSWFYYFMSKATTNFLPPSSSAYGGFFRRRQLKKTLYPVGKLLKSVLFAQEIQLSVNSTITRYPSTRQSLCQAHRGGKLRKKAKDQQSRLRSS